jgi:dTDP-glucose pyrophosphorylase
MADDIDGSILTFHSTHPKWSYAKLNEDGFVTEVAEKKPISEHATVGIYFFKKGADYIRCAESMIKKNIRVNNEFYVCPVYNEALLEGARVKTFHIDKMWGLGTPEDLDTFLKHDISIS